jgi:hypothetical protein
MNIYDDVRELIDASQRGQLFRATATGNATGNLYEIVRSGQTVADTERYPALFGTPALVLNDEIVIWSTGAGCIILGKVVR